MNDDLKALRELVEATRGDGGMGTLARCVICRVKRCDGGHEPFCPVPAAEAALERLERELPVEERLYMAHGSGLNEGWAMAKKQAAKIAEDVRDEEPWYDSHGFECGKAQTIVAKIRAMTPEGDDE